MDKQHYFYVLFCQDNTLYGGYTTDLQRRLKCHNTGKGAKYTRVKQRQPLEMIYAEVWSDKGLAMSQEAKFKQLSRKEKEAYLLLHGQDDILSKRLVIKSFIEKADGEEGGE